MFNVEDAAPTLSPTASNWCRRRLLTVLLVDQLALEMADCDMPWEEGEKSKTRSHHGQSCTPLCWMREIGGYESRVRL